jgi:anti-sigma factor RsiW
MSLFTGSRHPGDEDLIRYMDHQLDRDAQRFMGAHLRTCAECTARLEGFQQKSALVKEWLTLLPATLPDDGKRAMALAAVDRARFRRRRAAALLGSAPMRIAAAVVLMLAFGLGTEPGRAFVAGGVVKLAGRDPGPFATQLVQWLGQDRVLHPTAVAATGGVRTNEAAPVVPAAPVGAPRVETPAVLPRQATHTRVKPGMSAPVTFTPEGPDVSLVFRSVQNVGSATLSIRDVPRAQGQVWEHYRGEGLTPTRDGLEVRNERTSQADYMITVPSRYRFIRVRVGDSPEILIRISKSKQEWIWTINLQTSVLE